jgi:arginyl-tRNA synthetase
VRRCRVLALEIQREEQDRDLADFGVRFDVLTSETATYQRGAVAETLDLLAARELTYEKDGALWLRTTEFGDDLDRVLRKKDGSYTLLPARHRVPRRQVRRGFQWLIDVWGADHHGYIPACGRCSRLGYQDRASTWSWCSS